MKKNVCFTIMFLLIFIKSLSAFDNESLAECSALNNNLNHKYGAQLLDKGETQNTVMNDNLYSASSAYQLVVMAKVSYLEGWNINSFKKFKSEINKSDFFGRVFYYDTTSMQRLSVGSLLTKIIKKECFKKFQDFAKTPGKEDKILKNFDVIAPYIKQMRGF